MKTLLGVVAFLVGIPLVLGGLCGLAVSIPLSGSEPEFARAVGGYGLMALLLGCLLSWIGVSLIGVSLSGPAGKSKQWQAKPSEYRVCLYCGLKTNPSWRERCQICGKPLEHPTSDPPRSAHH